MRAVSAALRVGSFSLPPPLLLRDLSSWIRDFGCPRRHLKSILEEGKGRERRREHTNLLTQVHGACQHSYGCECSLTATPKIRGS